MAGQTLVLTTTLGVRPLGVRGEPLHAGQSQLRTAIRRRLGDRYANLLAEAQPHGDGPGLDWYTEVEGRVQPMHELSAGRRDAVLADVYRMLEEVAEVGRELARSGSGDAALTGRSLQLAAGRPRDDYVFLVGDQPVIVAWGYEHDQLPQPLVPFLPAAPPPPPPPMPARSLQPAVLATMPVAIAAPRPLWARFLSWLLLGLLLVLALLALSWLLRTCSPEPDVAIDRQPGEPPPAVAEVPDPTPDKRATLASLNDRGGELQGELTRLEADLLDKRANCKPPEKPQVVVAPPQVAVAPPPRQVQPAPRPPAPVVAAPPPPPPAPRPEPPRAEPPRQQAIAPPRQPQAPMTPPPGTVPCNVDMASGGQGVTRNRHFLGNSAGPVTIQYDMKTIPDQMNVYYQGQLVASTNQMTRGRGAVRFNWQPRGNDYTVTVEVVGPTHGTAWRYIVNCP